MMFSRPELSSELAKNWAPPGGVRTTARLPDHSTERIRSEGSGIDRAIEPSAVVPS